jgi:membrane protein
LAPLLIIVIAVAGAVFGVDAARGAIVGQIAGLVGASAAEAIQSSLKAAQETTTSVSPPSWVSRPCLSGQRRSWWS